MASEPIDAYAPQLMARAVRDVVEAQRRVVAMRWALEKEIARRDAAILAAARCGAWQSHLHQALKDALGRDGLSKARLSRMLAGTKRGRPA